MMALNVRTKYSNYFNRLKYKISILTCDIYVFRLQNVSHSPVVPNLGGQKYISKSNICQSIYFDLDIPFDCDIPLGLKSKIHTVHT